MRGQYGTEILSVVNGKVRLLKDTVTNSYSIAIATDKSVEWKFISEELHDLLVSELKEQVGNK